MSISDSDKVPMLRDILATLEIHSDLEDSATKLPLTQILEQCFLFAQANDLDTLAIFVKQELNGYSNEPPSNRSVQLSYFDVGGQRINGLSQYSSYPLTTGVRKLESRLKNGLALNLPTQVLTFLSQRSGCEVSSGNVSPSEIKKLLESIRHDVSQRLHAYKL